MNNDNKKSSNQMNTTPFNNNQTNNINQKNNLNIPKNNSASNNIISNHVPLPEKRNNEIKRDISSDNNTNKKEKSNFYDSKRINPKANGLSNTASNLRNKFHTNVNPNSNLEDSKNELKKDVMKKGSEALKNSANPYAKAAGYAMGAMQKRKEKKEKQKEEKEAEDKNNDNKETDDNKENEESVNTSIEGGKILKKILPILAMILPFFLVMIAIISLLLPAISAYSWFNNLFHHKDADSSSYTIYSEKDEKNYKAEQAYNDAILGSKDGKVVGIVSKYQEKYNVTIDWYLLNALITYRYTEMSNESMYSNDGSEDLNEDEINDKLEELEQKDSEEETEESTSDSGIDYTAAKKKIKSFATLMVVKDNGSWVTDTKKDGLVYNQILNSKTFKDYYKDSLKDNELETRKELLDKIYDYAETARELLKEDENPTSGGVIGDTSIVHVQTCAVPYSYKTVNGHKVYDNPVTSQGTSYQDYLNMKDYVKGVIMGEIGGYIQPQYKEALKVMAIASFSFILHDSKSGFDLKSGEMYFPSGNCRQVACDPTNGCTYIKGKTIGKYGTAFVGLKRFGNSGGQHKPLSASDNQLLEEVMNEVFGKVLVNKGVTSTSFSGSKDIIFLHYYDSISNSDFVPGYSIGQKQALADAKNGMKYTEILAKYYYKINYDIIDITEGIYIKTEGDYSGTINLNQAYHYHQSDSEWGNITLCGINGNIRVNGCNITSVAMAISLLKNQRITPKILNSRQKEIRTCSPSSRYLMIMDFAKLYGLKAEKINKGNTSKVKEMLNKLSSGNYVVVARLKANSGRYATRNGHYITLVGAKSESGSDKVLVWDPAGGSKRDNYWADLNKDIYGALQNDYSFILIGR